MGLKVRGKDIFPTIGEFTPTLIRRCAATIGLQKTFIVKTEVPATVSKSVKLPIRPPMLCPGCGHRALFYVLRESGALVMGDIGCYGLGSSSPLNSMHTSGCMGASIGVAHGIDKARVKDRKVAVIGDSTFFHSGIHPLIDVLYNNGATTTIITDNSITAMTGMQQHPGTGITLQKQKTKAVDLEKLVRAIGFEKVDIVDPYDIDKMAIVLEEHMESDKPSVIISKHPCVLYTRERHTPFQIDVDTCVDCGTCLELGCSPLMQEEGHISIDPLLCNGCGLCAKVCPAGAIVPQ